MRRVMIFVVFGLVLAVGAQAGPKPTKPTNAPKPTTMKTQAPKGGAPKSSTVKATTPKGSTVKATGTQAKASTVKAKGAQSTISTGKSAKPTTKSNTKLAKADAKAPKTEARSATSEPTTKKKTDTATSSGTSASTSNTSPSTRTSTAIDFTATTLGQKLQKNSAIRSKIEAKLQAAGYTGTVYEAAYGFKNLGQLNAATNQVQNQGYSFNLLKVLMTGTYVDPQTHVVYRANQLPDGTVNLVGGGSTNPASTQSLGQAKQAIAGGAEMPSVVRIPTTGTTTTTGASTTSTSSSSGTLSTGSTTTASKRKRQSKLK